MRTFLLFSICLVVGVVSGNKTTVSKPPSLFDDLLPNKQGLVLDVGGGRDFCENRVAEQRERMH